MHNCVRHSMKRLLILVPLTSVVLALVPACSTQDIVQQTEASVRNIINKEKLARSFLYTSSDVFYPDGSIDDIDKLPELNSDQRAEIQKQLDGQLSELVKYVGRHQPFLRNVFGAEVQPPAGFRMVISNTQLPRAFNTGGVITIDVKVVQAIYRGALLSALGIEQVGSREAQKDALNAFFALKKRIRETSAIKTYEDVKGIAANIAAERNLMDGVMAGVLDMFARSYDLGTAERMSAVYVDGLRYLVAHELGHIVLRHEAVAASLADRPDQLQEFIENKEFAADRLAVVIGNLFRNEHAKSLNPLPGSVARVQWGVLYTLCGSTWCRVTERGLCPLDDLNDFSGDHIFFNYAYGIAGFDSLIQEGEKTPPPKLRQQNAEKARRAVLASLTDAQQLTGKCSSASDELKRKYKADPGKAVLERWHSFQEREKIPEGVEICKTDDRGGKSCSTRIGSPRTYGVTDSLLDTELALLVFVDNFIRLSR